jgi:hypothetical protein
VPVVVEGLMDMHFYDFTFQREVQVEGLITLAGTHGQGQMMIMITLHPKNTRREKGKAIKVGILEVMMLK